MSDAKPTNAIARGSLYLGLASFGVGILYAVSQAQILGFLSLIGAGLSVLVAVVGFVAVLATFGRCGGIVHSLGGGVLGFICLGLFIPAG